MRIMTKLTIALILALAASGCTSTRISKSLSSGAIGCPESRIQIANETATIESLHNWVAICNGKKYVCSYHPTTNVNCHLAEDQNIPLEDVEE